MEEQHKPDMVRVNTRISLTANQWLDDQSKETGIPKSTMIFLVIENFIQQKEVMKRMADMGQLMEKLEDIERKIENKVK